MTYLSLRRTVYASLVALGLTAVLPDKAAAQQEAAKAFLLKAQQAYREAAYLGFRVKYVYTNAGEGAMAMDSLSGEMQLDKGRCRILMDGTETLVTGKYVIQVMEDDKAIYLSAAGKATPMDPTQLLDSAFKQLAGVQAALSSEGSWKVLTLRFPPGKMYTYIRMVMDPGTGYLLQMSYGIHTASLVEGDQIDRPGHPAPYRKEGHIDMFLSNYEHGRFGDGLFDEKNFFTRVSGQIEPAARYREYHIFLASSNL